MIGCRSSGGMQLLNAEPLIPFFTISDLSILMRNPPLPFLSAYNAAPSERPSVKRLLQSPSDIEKHKRLTGNMSRLGCAKLSCIPLFQSLLLSTRRWLLVCMTGRWLDLLSVGIMTQKHDELCRTRNSGARHCHVIINE